MADLFSLSFLIAVLVGVIAGMVRGFAGFGAAMVMTPVFSALYGPGQGVALCLLMEIVVALPLLRRAVGMVNWRRIGVILAAAVVGAPFGNLLLTSVPAQPMRWKLRCAARPTPPLSYCAPRAAGCAKARWWLCCVNSNRRRFRYIWCIRKGGGSGRRAGRHSASGQCVET